MFMKPIYEIYGCETQGMYALNHKYTMIMQYYVWDSLLTLYLWMYNLINILYITLGMYVRTILATKLLCNLKLLSWVWVFPS